MQGNSQHLIAYEGWKILYFLALLSLAGGLYASWFTGVLLFLMLAGLGFILRNPHRAIPSAPLAVVSPASGVVTEVSEVEDDWLSRPATRLRIRISLWDVHILRSPVEGKVMKQWAAPEPDLKGFDRRYTYWIKTDEDDDVVLSLVLGKWSPFTRVFFITGDRLGQGQACGFLYYTGLIEVLMPESARINIKPGERLESGSNILGNFVHENGSSVIGQ